MGSEYRDMADMRKQAASAALEKEGASRALTQQERFDATKSKLPMEHFLQALVGAAPVPTTEYSGALAAGTAPIAWPLLEEPLSEMDTQDRRRETQQRFADSASDAENARLDKEYSRAMGEATQGTKQERRALQTLEGIPEHSPTWWGTDTSYEEVKKAMDEYEAAPDAYSRAQAADKVDRALQTYNETAIPERTPEQYASQRDTIWEAAKENEWEPRDTRQELAESRFRESIDKRKGGKGPGIMDEALDAAFEGSARAAKAGTKMEDLKRIGKVAMKSAYVGPWLAMAEAAGGAAAVPFLAADNYMKIKDPAEQIRFIALHGVQRPLEPGDLSPHGLAWLDSHTPQTNALYRQGILGAELYQTLMRPEGLEAAKQEAQAAYDSAEKWTPSKEQIQSLSR